MAAPGAADWAAAGESKLIMLINPMQVSAVVVIRAEDKAPAVSGCDLGVWGVPLYWLAAGKVDPLILHPSLNCAQTLIFVISDGLEGILLHMRIDRKNEMRASIWMLSDPKRKFLSCCTIF